MKKHIGFIYTLLLVFALTVVSFGQKTIQDTPDDKSIIINGNAASNYVTTTSSAVTTPFSLTDQDAFSWVTYPWTVTIGASVPTTGTIDIVTYLQGSFLGDAWSWTNIDTLASSDSTLTTSPTRFKGITFNNIKYPYYRWEFDGQTGNSDSVMVTVKQWNPMYDKFLAR